MRVGVLLLASLAVAVFAIFFIGKETSLFSLKNEYFIRFQSVSGLKAGNPVQLNGVEVGTVERVILPEDPDESTIQVWITIERRYAERVRQDSQGRIKTLGLLGDKYVEITSGSPEAPQVASGEEIPAAPATDVDALLASGEDTMDNVVAISASLKSILERMESGEGLLGQLTANTPEGERFSESVVRTMETVERVANKIEGGEGPLGHLLNDAEMSARLDSVLTRLDTLLADAREGEGLLPAMLNDPATKERFDQVLTDLSSTSADVSAFTERIESSEGLLQKLLTDEEYSRQVSDDLRQLIERLNGIAAALDEGDGTAARLIHDPAIYEALNDIVVGINQSKMLRWLIRNRQKKGIEKRYDDAQGGGGAGQAGAEEEPPPRVEEPETGEPAPDATETDPSPSATPHTSPEQRYRPPAAPGRPKAPDAPA
jgi:phospholipid/cholesterol/gamma-HCH transport system substrate-binding protein